MSTTMWGADVEALQNCAGTFDEGAELIEQSRTTVDSALGSAQWVGGDADDFRQRWSGTTAPQLQVIVDALREGASDLRRHADQQRDASSADGAGGVGGLGGLLGGLLGGAVAGVGALVGGIGGALAGLADSLALGGDSEAGANGPSFSDQVYGQDAQEIDFDLAQLANEVYPGKSSLPDGWEQVSDEQLAGLGIDTSALADDGSGFSAGVYVDENGNYVLAFAGTDEGTDWLNNAQQGVGMDAEQYNQALSLAKEAKAAFGDDLVITGHSLGGGLASHAAIGTDTPAVTFNAAGLHDSSMERAGVDPSAGRQSAEDGLVRRYTVESDILTFYQEDNWTGGAAPDGAGHRINLTDPEPLPGWFQGRTEHRTNMHSMDSVLEAMENDRPWE